MRRKSKLVPAESAAGTGNGTPHVQSRARDPIPTDSLTFQQKVDVCLEIMRREEWVRGGTVKKLMVELGGTEHAWQRASATAAGVRRRELPDETVLGQVESHMADIIELAKEAGEFSGAVSAGKLMLDARGLLVRRHEHDVNVQQKTGPELFAQALELPAFREYLVSQGWREPEPALLTEGVEAE